MYIAFRLVFRTVPRSKMAWEPVPLNFADHFHAVDYTYVAGATSEYSNGIQ